MLPQVLLLGRSEINWGLFLKTSKDVLGTTISKSIDSQGLQPGSVASFIYTLSEFKTGDKQTNLLENPGHILQHIYYQFLIICDDSTLRSLMEESNLNFVITESPNHTWLSVVSGTLEEWRTTIINHCSVTSSFDIRLLCDKIILAFDGEGIKKLFGDTRRLGLPDKTFALESR